MLHYAGPAVDEIFDTLPDTGEDKDYKAAVDALNAYFIPQANSAFEEYNFRQAKQQHGENIDAFHTRLRQLALTCEFANIDKEVKAQIIIGCSSQQLRRQALRDNPSMKDLLTIVRAQERSEAQATAVEKGASPINAVKNEPRDTRNNKTHGKHRESKLKHPSNTGTYKTTRPSTPFAKVCRSKTKRQEIR